VDRHGRAAAFTGGNCVEWCGEITSTGVSIAGNMLAGQAVIADTYVAYVANTDLPLPLRLLAALDAGEAAGGDKRGRQSAAMVMVTTEDFPDLSLRVDDHPQPLAELRRLHGIWLRDRAPWLADQPSKARPSGTIDMNAIEARWKRQGLDLKFRR
jgi:uncharacterized Ntn-hydrolase superfamily protein